MNSDRATGLFLLGGTGVAILLLLYLILPNTVAGWLLWIGAVVTALYAIYRVEGKSRRSQSEVYYVG